MRLPSSLKGAKAPFSSISLSGATEVANAICGHMTALTKIGSRPRGRPNQVLRPPLRRPPASLLPLPRRTQEEFVAGHAPQAVNIPYMVQTAEGRAYNDQFLQQVEGRRGRRRLWPGRHGCTRLKPLLAPAPPSRRRPGWPLCAGSLSVRAQAAHPDLKPRCLVPRCQVRQAFPDKTAAQLCVTCGGGTRGTSAATVLAEEGYNVKCMPGEQGAQG